MTTFEEILPATATSARNGIKWTPETGRLAINTGRKVDQYIVREFPADGGRGFRFTKLTPGTDIAAESYDVFCHNPAIGGFDSCECKGFIRHGHCKHREAVVAILENEFIWSRAEVPAEESAAPTITPEEALETVLRNLATPTRRYAATIPTAPKPAAVTLTKWDREQENFRW